MTEQNLGALLQAKRKVYHRTCPVCKEEFHGIKIAVYCSNKCRQKAFKERRK